MKEISAFWSAHQDVIVALLVLLAAAASAKYPQVRTVLKIIEDVMGGIEKVSVGAPAPGVPSVTKQLHESIAARTPLTLPQVAKLVKVEDGNLKVNKLGVATAIVNSGDWKKAERKFKKFLKKI